MSEVFRFVTQRPVQRAAPEDVRRKLINAYDPSAEPTSLRMRLREKRAQGDREGMDQVSKEFVSSSRFVPSLGSLTTPLAKLDAWLLDRGDQAPPAQVSDQVKALTGKKPDALIATPQYKDERLRVADSLLALTVTPSGRERPRSHLLRGMYLFGLIERLASEPPSPGPNVSGQTDRDDRGRNRGGGRTDDEGNRRDGESVYQLLTRGIITLPSDIFPLPPRQPSDDTPPVVNVGTSAATTPAKQLEAVLGAMEELMAAFRSRTSVELSVDDGVTGVSQQARWALSEPAVAQLSEGTLAVAERVAGPVALANVPETLVRLESEAAMLGAAVAPNGRATKLVALGDRYVAVSHLLDSAKSLDARAQRLPADALVRAPGIAELKVVRQKLKRYEMGEVAYIENVLKGETKERLHRRKTATEITELLETERTEESEQDLQTTQRFELQREATRTAHEDSQLQAGVTVTASYGPTLSVTGSLSYASNHSKDESARESSNYARDVTERSVTRIQERVREQRITRTLTEVEETNKHGVDNAAGTGHVVGIYRWVDKIYEAQVFNYGKRLLLELSVPEPAAFFLYSLAARSPEGITIEKPAPPMVPDGQGNTRPLSPADVTIESYLAWVQRYHVANVSPPPKLYDTVSLALEEPATEDRKRRTVFKANTELKIPDGYKAIKYIINCNTDNGAREFMLLSWLVGDHSSHFAGDPPTNKHAPWSFLEGYDLPHHTQGSLPIGLYFHDVWGFAVAFEVVCERTPEKLAEWQLKTYEAIMRAYFELKAQYDEQVAAATAQAGIALPGRNPQRNRAIEQAELKKAAITMLRGGHFEDFNAIGQDPGTRYPEIDIEEAQTEGRLIQFFEQAFEWPQMTYVFYPYFWGRKDRWITSSQLDEAADPVFGEFLRAGAARVVVPVRSGFETIVSHYLATDEIWEGGQVPHVGDDLYI
ncbi:MAG: hypothetical protein M3281_04870, partial [Chloroflexota bacterium]|nr:hypothetical protein [Chloroflexota bacterium]